MRKIRRNAAASAAALAAVTILFAIRALAQFSPPPDLNFYLTEGENEIGTGMLDQATHDLTQAFQLAKKNGDVGTLLRLAGDFRNLSMKEMPGSQAASDQEANVTGALVTALDTAHDKACYDPNVPNSGKDVSGGRGDLQRFIAFFNQEFGPPNTSAPGLTGVVSGLGLAAEGYLEESESGSPACPPAPMATPTNTPTPPPPAAPAPAPAPAGPPQPPAGPVVVVCAPGLCADSAGNCTISCPGPTPGATEPNPTGTSA